MKNIQNSHKMNHWTKKCRSGGITGRSLRQFMSLVLLVTGFATTSHAQTPDCNIIMACNDLVQVSLGENCTELLVPDMILEDPFYPDNFYSVTLYRENGSIVNDNILRQNMIGELLSAKIGLIGCDISCWGNLTVEDKLIPEISIFHEQADKKRC